MSENKDETPPSPDIHFEPLVNLAPVETVTNEEDEIVLFFERAKLYRFTTTTESPEWKERGTGEVKLLRNKVSGRKRIVMRRDKTFKVCCNHYVTPDMKLTPSAGSEKAWIWNTPADFADEKPKFEMLAIRFKDASIASRFKEAFEAVAEEEKEDESKDKDQNESENVEDVRETLEGLSVADTSKEVKGDTGSADGSKEEECSTKHENSSIVEGKDDTSAENVEKTDNDKSSKEENNETTNDDNSKVTASPAATASSTND